MIFVNTISNSDVNNWSQNYSNYKRLHISEVKKVKKFEKVTFQRVMVIKGQLYSGKENRELDLFGFTIHGNIFKVPIYLFIYL